MKLINFCFVLVVFCNVFRTIHCEILNCEFGDWRGYYACTVSSLENKYNDMVITGHSGFHNPFYNDNNVEAIYTQDTNTKYIPTGLGTLFNLISLVLKNTQLVQIKSLDFSGMENLEELGLIYNALYYVPIDAFSTLTKLKVISLYSNEIEEIPNGVFANNPKLKTIELHQNKIKFLGSTLFDELTNLDFVNLRENICMKNEYYGSTEIIQLKKDIKIKCKKHNEQRQRTMTTTQRSIQISRATTQNQMTKRIDSLERENAELKNVQINLNEINEELSEANRQQNQEKLAMEELSKEKDVLIKIIEDSKSKDRVDFETKIQELTRLLSSCESNNQQTMNNLPNFNTFDVSCNFVRINGEYTCDSTDLPIIQKNMKLNQVIGTHLRPYSNQRVTELIVVDTNTLFWSNEIFQIFPTLKALRIHNANLTEISTGDFASAEKLKTLEVFGNQLRSLGNNSFQGAENLLNIELDSNQIEKLFVDTFLGLTKLTFLSLSDNLITEVPVGIFKDLQNLKTLKLKGNQLKFLHGDLLQFNVNLVIFSVNENKLKEIGVKFLDYSKKLEDADFTKNKCIDENSAVIGMKKVKNSIKNNCDMDGQCRYLSDIIKIMV